MPVRLSATAVAVLADATSENSLGQRCRPDQKRGISRFESSQYPFRVIEIAPEGG